MEHDRRAAIEALKQSFREEQEGRAFRQRWQLPLGKITVTLVVLLGVAVLLTALGYTVGHIRDSLDTTAVINQFCDRDANHQFGSAYLLLSRHLRSEISQTDLARATERAQLGACTYAERPWSIDRSRNPVVVQVILKADNIPGAHDNTGIGVFMLVREGSAWKIDRIQTDAITLP